MVFISTPWIVQVSTYGLVEGAAALYLLVAWYAVVLWHRGDVAPKPALMLAGYLAGGAAACKD